MSLVELMAAVCIVLIAIVGILYAYMKAIELHSIARGAAVATHGVKNKIEEIKGAAHANIYSTYNNSTFTLPGITNGKGVVYVNNDIANLLVVKVVFCWKLEGGRVIGEDTNLNGVLDSGEDQRDRDGAYNGKLDSYVQITTQIYG